MVPIDPLTRILKSSRSLNNADFAAEMARAEAARAQIYANPPDPFLGNFLSSDGMPFQPYRHQEDLWKALKKSVLEKRSPITNIMSARSTGTTTILDLFVIYYGMVLNNANILNIHLHSSLAEQSMCKVHKLLSSIDLPHYINTTTRSIRLPNSSNIEFIPIQRLGRGARYNSDLTVVDNAERLPDRAYDMLKCSMRHDSQMVLSGSPYRSPSEFKNICDNYPTFSVQFTDGDLKFADMTPF